MDPPPGPSDQTRVLVAEDNRAVADMVARVLRAWGYEPLLAYGGRSALALARGRPPDVALVDLDLPDLSGEEVARRLRRQPGPGRVLVVTMSGDEGGEAGADWHLRKPFPLEALEQALASARPRG
jgi:DNA-binding response OmpR family regulator